MKISKVCLILDDIDRHGEGCDCGLCNVNGKSYGFAIYAKKATLAATVAGSLLDRIYGTSEEMALNNARLVCKDHDWIPMDQFDEF